MKFNPFSVKRNFATPLQKKSREGNKGQRKLINLVSQYQHIYDNTGQYILPATTLFLSFEFYVYLHLTIVIARLNFSLQGLPTEDVNILRLKVNNIQPDINNPSGLRHCKYIY